MESEKISYHHFRIIFEAPEKLDMDSEKISYHHFRIINLKPLSN